VAVCKFADLVRINTDKIVTVTRIIPRIIEVNLILRLIKYSFFIGYNFINNFNKAMIYTGMISLLFITGNLIVYFLIIHNLIHKILFEAESRE